MVRFPSRIEMPSSLRGIGGSFGSVSRVDLPSGRVAGEFQPRPSVLGGGNIDIPSRADVPSSRLELDAPRNKVDVDAPRNKSGADAPRNKSGADAPSGKKKGGDEPEPSGFIKKNKNKLIAAGVLGTMGIGAYLVNENDKDVNEARKQCAELCMPTCWDCNKYPDQFTACTSPGQPEGCSDCKNKDGSCDQLEINSLEKLKATLGEEPDEINGEPWSKQPWCDPTEPNCPGWCVEKCKEVHPKFIDEAKDFLSAPFDAVGGFLGGLSDTVQQVIFWGLVLGGIVLIIMLIRYFNKKQQTVVQRINPYNSL